MERLSLKELNQLPPTIPESAEIHAQLTQRSQKITRNNKPYLDITLADGEETVSFKVWEDKPWYSSLTQTPERDFLSLTGYWMKGEYGIEVNELVVRPLEEAEREALLLGNPELKLRQEKALDDILRHVASFADPRLKEISGLFLQKYGERFRRTAAARAYHHNRRGGLVEHIAGMMNCANAVCSAYPELNRDLVLTGCLFHDAGKLWENCYQEADFVMPYSEAGELLGHIPLGIELVNNLWKEMFASPQAKDWIVLSPPSSEVRMHLLHLIAAHHGELAFGSPVPPKTPEAIVLHYVDNMDAKLEMFRSAYDTSDLLGNNIFQKKAPLPGNEVRPLPHFIPLDTPEQNTGNGSLL